MHPVLLEFGPITIYAYGVFVTAAFLAGMGWTIREARTRDLDPTLVPRIGLIAICSGLLGARLLYVLIAPNQFIENPLEVLQIWKGGLVFSGGLIAGAASVLWFMRNEPHRMEWLDSVAPALALGQAIGRIGCFMAGCYYGSRTLLPWAVTYTDPLSLAPLFRPLHPTQIYHSLAGLITFLILLLAKRTLKSPGRLTGLFLVLFATFRIIIEFFRADYRGDLAFVSVTQIIAACAFLLGLFLLLRKHARS